MIPVDTERITSRIDTYRQNLQTLHAQLATAEQNAKDVRRQIVLHEGAIAALEALVSDNPESEPGGDAGSASDRAAGPGSGGSTGPD